MRIKKLVIIFSPSQ